MAGESGDKVSLREFLEEKIEHLSTRLNSLDAKYNAAIESEERAREAQSKSSKEAIGKAEEAQRAYNIGHNDLSRKMDEQYKSMVPKPEFVLKNDAVEREIEDNRKQLEVMRELLPREVGLLRIELMKEIAGLRESRSEGGGKAAGVQASTAFVISAFGVVLGLISAAIAIAAFLRK